MKIPEAQQLSPNEIQATYVQMRNGGQNCVGRLGKEPAYISIEQWRDEQLAIYQKLNFGNLD